MLKSYLKITFRSLWKNKAFVFINVFGMGIAIACCIIAYLNYDYNKKYDVEHTNASTIYRLNSERTFQGNTRKLGLAPRPLGDLARENIQDIDKVANLLPTGGNIRIGDEFFRTNISYMDPEFMQMFTFPMIQGTIDLNNRSNIYLSDKLAEKYFGQEDPVGKVITHVLDSGVVDYTVAGIFEKKPSNSSFAFLESFTHYDNFFSTYPDNDRNDWKVWNTTFIQLYDKNRISVIEEQLDGYLELQNKAREDYQLTQYYLDPLPGMAMRSEQEDIGHWLRGGMPVAAFVAPMIMAGFILLLACFNFTNTSIAISGKRLKEIGLRKVMGGVRSQLIRQFLTENILLCFMALVVGLIIAEVLVPAYSQMWEFLDIALDYSENFGLIAFLFGLLIVTGILAGSYPAFYISKFEPASILKGTQKFGGTSGFTRFLLGAQLTIALMAIIMGVAFVQNAKFQKDFDLGYEGDGIIHVAVNGENEYEIYKNAVINDPLILSYSGSQHQLMESYRNDPVKHEEVEHEVDIVNVDERYFETMDIEILSGRNFKTDSETDRKESIIVTKEFANLFGWEDPIGKRITWMDTVQLFVIGTVDDIYTNALWDPLTPLMFRYAERENYNFVTLKSNPGDVVEANQYLESKWKEIFPNRLYTGEYINIEIAEAAMVNNNILKLFLFLGIVAAILAISGLFTLVSLNIIKRIKEIAVRKILGASIGNIAAKLNLQFLIIMLIAIVISSIGSYFMVDMLMGSIWAYHIDVNFLLFIISGLLMLAASTLTVGLKVFNAASMNPVNALRNE